MNYFRSNTRGIISAGAMVLIIAAVMTIFTHDIRADARAQNMTSTSQRQITTLADLNKAFIDVSSAIKPTVVTVSTERTLTATAMPFSGDPFLEFFFGQNRPDNGRNSPEYHQHGLGSGVIVQPDGYILTNNHVIDNADSIYVRTIDSRRYSAKIIGVDDQTDIAVLKIDGQNLPYIEFGNSDSLQVGEMVLAIGSPMSENLAYTVTQGIVSAIGRSNVGLADYEDFIQTDAAINPGNSGGPLIDLNGKLVGINTAIASQSGGFQGIGFAVPVNMAEHVMNSLINDGRVIRGWLGVSIQDMNGPLATAMGIKQNTGALVGDIVPNSPADKSGLKSGDLIIAMNKNEIRNASDLRNRVAATSPGGRVDLTVLRKNKKEDIQVELGELNSNIAQANNPELMQERYGFSITPLRPEFRSQYGLADDLRGVGVASVDMGGNAYVAGLRAGDVIQEVNGEKVNSPQEFEKAASNIKKGDPMLFKDYRNGYGFYVAFRA